MTSLQLTQTIRFGLALILTATSLSVSSVSTAQNQPKEEKISLSTEAFELQGEGESLKGESLRVSSSEVEVRDEQKVAEWVIQNQEARARQGDKGFSIILFKEDGKLSQFLKSAQERLARIGVFALEVPKPVAEASPAPTNAQPWSVASMRSAGVLVSVGLVSVSGSVYFATHEVGPAALAATLSFGFHLIGNRFAQEQLRFFNSGGELLEKMASKVSRLSEKGKVAANELGRWVNGYLYNVFGTALFAVALSSAPLPVDLASSAKFAEFVGTTALFYLFADNSWDMAFAKLMQEAEKNKDERRIKTLIFMKYSKSAFGTLLGPLMFIPELRPIAMIGLGAFGTLGLIANRYPAPFVNLADVALGRLENSKFVGRATGAFTNMSQSLRSIRSSRAAASCRSLFLLN